MRRLVKTRKRYISFSRGNIRFLETENSKILVFVRQHEDEIILVAINLSRYAQSAAVEMKDFRDLIPAEIFSQNTFTKIGSEPYIFTFAPYGYYWFRLVKEEEKEQNIIPEVKSGEYLIQIDNWEQLWENNNLEILENQVLRSYLNAMSWFNPLHRKVESIKLFDLLPLHSRRYHFSGITMVIQVNYFEGIYEKYRLVVSFKNKSAAKNLTDSFPGSIITKMVFDGQKGVMCDASYNPSYLKTLLSMIIFVKGTVVGIPSRENSSSPREATSRASSRSLPVKMSFAIMES